MLSKSHNDKIRWSHSDNLGTPAHQSNVAPSSLLEASYKRNLTGLYLTYTEAEADNFPKISEYMEAFNDKTIRDELTYLIHIFFLWSYLHFHYSQ